MVKLNTGCGCGGGKGSGEGSWGTSGPVRITGRELMSMVTPRKVAACSSLKRTDPESHTLAWRRGSDGAELVKKNIAAAANTSPIFFVGLDYWTGLLEH